VGDEVPPTTVYRGVYIGTLKSLKVWSEAGGIRSEEEAEGGEWAGGEAGGTSLTNSEPVHGPVRVVTDSVASNSEG
jgi:hypothetical protein